MLNVRKNKKLIWEDIKNDYFFDPEEMENGDGNTTAMNAVYNGNL